MISAISARGRQRSWHVWGQNGLTSDSGSCLAPVSCFRAKRHFSGPLETDFGKWRPLTRAANETLIEICIQNKRFPTCFQSVVLSFQFERFHQIPIECTRTTIVLSDHAKA